MALFYLTLIISFIFHLMSFNSAYAATTSTISNSNGSTANLKSNATSSAGEIEKLKQQVDQLEEKIVSWTEAAKLIALFITIVAGIVTIFSIRGWLMSESRSNKAEKMIFAAEERSMQSHSLAIRGEKSSQKRDEVNFKQSQETLTLVNETLGLAKEASLRASKTLENKLIKQSKEIEYASSIFLQEIEAYTDDKNLVGKKETTIEVHRLGDKIIGFENNLMILTDSDIESLPHSLFILGMDCHLKQQFNEAIEFWKKLTLDPKSPNELKSLAYFWIGYEHNNRNKFDEAIRNFKQASEFSKGNRKYELLRIRYESMFFKKDDINELIDLMNKLIEDFKLENKKAVDMDTKKQEIKIHTTLGNIYFQAGNENEQSRNKHYENSKKEFMLAKKASVTVNIWAQFGYAEAIYALGDEQKAIELFADKIMKGAERELVNREERRTKVLAKSTQLICKIRANDPFDQVKDYQNQVITLAGDVDSRLTIYSQVQRRNVDRNQFLSDFEKLVDQYEEKDKKK